MVNSLVQHLTFLLFTRYPVVPYCYTHVALSWLDVGYHATLCIHTYHMYSMPVITCLCLSMPMIIFCRFPGRGTAPYSTIQHQTPPDTTGHYRTLPDMSTRGTVQNGSDMPDTESDIPDIKSDNTPDTTGHPNRTHTGHSPDITGHHRTYRTSGHPGLSVFTQSKDPSMSVAKLLWERA